VEVLEYQVVGKQGDPDLCEDVILIASDLVAVIDGSTDKHGLRAPDGRTGGRLAADLIAQWLPRLLSRAPHEQVAELSARLSAEFKALGFGEADHVRPGATAAWYSARTRQVVRVGDIRVAIGEFASAGDKRIDVILGDARAAYTEMLLIEGADPTTLAANDPGRELIMPALKRQGLLANHPSSWLRYGTLDGREVPHECVEVFDVPVGAEVVLASDGYPAAARTLAEAEGQLQELIQHDPQQIRLRRGTKGLRPGAHSFDDRAYVRLRA